MAGRGQNVGNCENHASVPRLLAGIVGSAPVNYCTVQIKITEKDVDFVFILILLFIIYDKQRTDFSFLQISDLRNTQLDR